MVLHVSDGNIACLTFDAYIFRAWAGDRFFLIAVYNKTFKSFFCIKIIVFSGIRTI